MRPAAFVAALLGAGALAALAVVAPQAAADGWRAAFLSLSAAPIGAIALLLIARVVGADWDAALRPLLAWMPWTVALLVPVAVGQALFHWPEGHLHLWLSPALFVLRSAVAMAFWIAVSRALARDTATQAGPLLLAHGLVVSVMGYDWLLGGSPAQPQSAAPMVLATMQIGAGAAAACALRLGTAAQRRDLAYLLIAAALGLAYLLYIDFAIVWFGDLPGHVGWYADRYDAPAVLLPGLALAIGLVAPILLIGIGARDATRQTAGVAALVALALIATWFVAGATGWAGPAAALAGIVAIAALARVVPA